MKMRAPAKLNLYLRVHGKRPDGFHEIETLMVPVSLADTLTIKTSLGRGIRISCDDPSIPADDSNLAAAAARQFYGHTGIQFSVHIHIQKNIPAGAGLGGGSSDAAATLVALDAIFETRLGVQTLERIAANLGSDVPFFIRGTAAVCRGRGEMTTPVAMPHRFKILLIKPPFAVNTPWAYKAWSASKELPGDNYLPQKLGDFEMVNDLERPVFEKYLLLFVIKDWLKRQPETMAALMSGSGSTMFGVLREGAIGSALEARFREEFGDGYFTHLVETD